MQKYDEVHEIIKEVLQKHKVIALVGQDTDFLKGTVGVWGFCFPEWGLHPIKQTQWIKETLESNREVVFCTHSPYMLDSLDFEQVIVCHQGKCKQLSQHPAAERAREAMTAGQLWTMEGEEWITK